MTYCKWCGMESKDDMRCEWCGRPFPTQVGEQATTAVSQQTTAMPPQQSPAPPYQGGNQDRTIIAPLANAPKPDGEEPPHPNYMSGKAQATTAMPSATADPRARVAHVTAAYGDSDSTPSLLPFWWRLERYLGVLLPLLGIAIFVAHQFPDVWLVPFLLLLFPSGMLMASFRAVGYYDDEFLDTGVLLAASAVVGPVYGTALYVLIALVKQEVNRSMLALVASYMVFLLAVGGAAGGAEEIINYMLMPRFALDPISWLIQIFPLTLLFGGWMCASFTRPLNE